MNCQTHLNAALHCKDQAAQKRLNKSSGVQRERSPNRSHYIRFNFNAGCSAGSAPFLLIRRITPYLFIAKG